MIGIYKIENKVNGKVYIGQSKCIEYRWWRHKRDLNANEHENIYLQNSWNKNGETAFEFILIEECLEEELNDKEIYWIQQYDSYKNGYNLTLGGGGTKYIVPLLQFDLAGNFIKEWEGVYIAATELGINPNTIYGCCNRKYKHAGKFIWIFKSDYIDKQSLNWHLTDQKLQQVLQYDLYGKLIAIYTCCQEAWDILGFNPIQCLLHERKSVNGFIFKYANDSLEINEEYCRLVRETVEKLKSKKIFQIKDNKIVNIFNSLRETERAGYSRYMIRECCNGSKKEYKGCIWTDKEDVAKQSTSSFLLE